jgi:hypothetical protein
MSDPAWGATSAWDQRHGCAWFTDAQQPVPKTGWYAIAGEPAQAFSPDQPLPPEAVFWTNLTPAQIWAMGQWQRRHPAAWFGDSVMSWRQDAPAYGAPEVATARWSETVQRMALFWSAWAKERTPQLPWDWGQGAVSEAVQARLPLLSSDTEGLPEPLVRETSQTSLKVQWPSGPWGQWRKVVFRHSPVAQLRGLKGLRVPQGPWTPWPCSASPQPDRWTWIRTQQLPVLVRVGELQWRVGHSERGEVWLGQRGRVFSAASMEPFWITGEEALELAGLAEVTWLDGYQAHAWDTLQVDPLWLPDENNTLQAVSLTQQWVASAAWRSLAHPGRDPQTRQPMAPRTSWLWAQAWDRSQMRRRAQVFLDRGAVVLEYGDASLTVAWPEHQSAQDIVEACRQAQLMVPPLLAQARPPAGVDVTRPWDLQYWLDAQAKAHPDLRWDIDRLVFPWPGTGVKGVMKDAVRRLLAVPLPQDAGMPAWKNLLQVQAQQAVNRLTR